MLFPRCIGAVACHEGVGDDGHSHRYNLGRGRELHSQLKVSCLGDGPELIQQKNARVGEEERADGAEVETDAAAQQLADGVAGDRQRPALAQHACQAESDNDHR